MIYSFFKPNVADGEALDKRNRAANAFTRSDLTLTRARAALQTSRDSRSASSFSQVRPDLSDLRWIAGNETLREPR